MNKELESLIEDRTTIIAAIKMLYDVTYKVKERESIHMFCMLHELRDSIIKDIDNIEKCKTISEPCPLDILDGFA